MKDFKEYIEHTKRTRPKLNDIHSLINSVLGIAGESGEIVDFIKKVIYQGHDTIDVEKIKEEIGDLMWYLAWMIDLLELDFNDILSSNIEKLNERYPDEFSIEKSINRKEYKTNENKTE